MFHLIYMYLSRSKKAKQAVFCATYVNLHLNSHIALPFSYLEVARESPDSAMKQLSVWRTQAYQQIWQRLLQQTPSFQNMKPNLNLKYVSEISGGQVFISSNIQKTLKSSLICSVALGDPTSVCDKVL